MLYKLYIYSLMYKLIKKHKYWWICTKNSWNTNKYTNKIQIANYFKISLIILGITILIPFIIGFVHGVTNTPVEEAEKFFENVEPTITFLITIALIFGIYFDGKRDGAIEQFKRSINCKN